MPLGFVARTRRVVPVVSRSPLRLGWAAEEHLECSGIELKAAEITAHSGGKIEHFVLTGCTYKVARGGCRLKSKTIESEPLTMEATLGKASPEDIVKLKPVSGNAFTEFTLEGEGDFCQPGVRKVTGELELVLPKGREELAQQTARVQINEGELKIGGANAFVIGTENQAGIKLASGKAWSFH